MQNLLLKEWQINMKNKLLAKAQKSKYLIRYMEKYIENGKNLNIYNLVDKFSSLLEDDDSWEYILSL